MVIKMIMDIIKDKDTKRMVVVLVVMGIVCNILDHLMGATKETIIIGAIISGAITGLLLFNFKPNKQ